eukprot:scaffold132647_cov33-Prasinocladus_malaysianus.AAC.1
MPGYFISCLPALCIPVQAHADRRGGLRRAVQGTDSLFVPGPRAAFAAALTRPLLGGLMTCVAAIGSGRTARSAQASRRLRARMQVGRGWAGCC